MRVAGIGLPTRGPNNALPLSRKVSPKVAPWVFEELVPGSRGQVLYPGFGDTPDRFAHYGINAFGFRDLPFPKAKPPGVYRIAVLGDSVAYGTGVEMEHTLPRQLQSRFEELFGNQKVEVMNCAVFNYNLRQEVGLLRYKVVEWQPDMVILCAAINDASGAGITERKEEVWETRWVRRLGLTSGVHEDKGLAEARDEPPAVRHMNSVRRHSVLIDHLAHIAFNSLYSSAKDKGFEADWAPGSPGRLQVQEALEWAKRTALRDGFELRVTMYPSLNGSLDEDFVGSEQTAVLAEMCAELELPFLDLLPALANKPVKKLRAHPHDRHPNPIAHAYVAHFLADALTAKDSTFAAPALTQLEPLVAEAE